MVRTWKIDRAVEVYVETIRFGEGFPDMEKEIWDEHDVVDLESENDGDDGTRAVGIESDGFGASVGNRVVGGEPDGFGAVDGGDTISISREDPIISSSHPHGEDAPIDGHGATIDGDANQFDEYEETEDSGIDDEEEDHISVDGVSFCSDRVDEELVSLMKDAENIIDTAATHGPETDAIRHNRRELNRNNSDDEYDVGTNYMRRRITSLFCMLDVGPSVETNGRDINTTFMPTPRLVKKRKGKDLMANAPKKPWK